MLTATLAGLGNPLIHSQASGQVLSIPAPVPAAGRSSLAVVFGETPSAATPQPVTIEISVNRCPGVVDTDTSSFCNLRSTNGSYNAITYFQRPYQTINSAQSATQYGYCWAPEALGPWYINARWTYSVCGFGQPTCGFAIQYNLGPF